MNIKRLVLAALLGVSVLAISACGTNSTEKSVTSVAQAETVTKMPNFTNAPMEDQYAIFDTNYGQIKIRLYGSKAPITVKNFDYLVKQGYYNGVTFHRVIDGFMIQGGDPSGTGAGGPGYEIPDEFSNDLHFNRMGILAMANRGPNTGGSQFFITLGPTPHLDNKHTIFGVVVQGMDVVEKIGKVKTDNRDKPVEPVVINSISMEPITDDATK